MRTFALLLLTICFAFTVAVHYHEAVRDIGQNSPVAAANNYVRACYFTNWAQYRTGRAKYQPEDYVPGLCTHIMYAFGWMNSDYTARAYDETDLPTDWAGPGNYYRVNQLKQKQAGLKTSLSFGGWTFGTSLFNSMASTPENRATFINSAIKFVRKYNFDGIDIDWEYPSGNKFYTSFIQELRQSINAEARLSGNSPLLLTGAMAAGASNIEGYDVPNIAPSFDFLMIMTYDFWGAWAGETGMNSPLYSRPNLPAGEEKWNVDWAVNQWVKLGAPKSKILIGVGAYGRGWTLANPQNIQPGSENNQAAPAQRYTNQAGIAAYYEICEMLAGGATRYWQSDMQVPWLIYNNQWWSYDDMQSTKAKTDYIQANNFAGAFTWTLDLDDFNGECSNSPGVLFPILGTIAKELGGVIIQGHNGTIPTGQPTVPTRPPVVSTAQPVSVGPTGPPPTGAFTCSGKPDGFYADPLDCAGFYRCVSGVAYHFECPSGTYWDEANTDCTFTKPSNC